MTEFDLLRHSQREGRIVTRCHNPQSAMVWAAVTETGRSPLLFVPSGVKLNFQRYIADILEGCLLPWTKKHFQGVPWSLQQGSVPSHASLLMNEGIFLCIQNWVILEAWEGAESCCRNQRTPCKCFFAQGSRQPSKLWAM